MTPETKEALEKCIEKYDNASKGKRIKLGVNACALCHLFFLKECIDCPVSIKTGTDCCDGSPYPEFEKVYRKYHHSSGIYKDAARQERDFLISLREE